MIDKPPACKMVESPGACKGSPRGEAPKKILGKPVRVILGDPRGLPGPNRRVLENRRGRNER